MNYQETIDYLFGQLAMYQREGAKALKADLKNIISLCTALDNPQLKFKSIHIAGTNGKGSTSHMLASVLQQAGYKVGLYTSPHLKDFRERIKINGKPIPEKEVIDFVALNKTSFQKIQPSFFEMTVGLAFKHFAEEKVDFAIIETGLGGRLDATNIINPILSVITNISLDHTFFLGNTLQSIAFEKAGIIKANTPIVIGETHKETENVFIKKALEQNANITFADKELKVQTSEYTNHTLKLTLESSIIKTLPTIDCDLSGSYQQKNIITALVAIHKLKQLGLTLTDRHIEKGFMSVVSTSGLLGRWQILSNKPLTICDIGHNEEGINQICEQIKATPHTHLHFILGLVNDKDLNNILINLPKNATYYFCKANIPRALDAEALQKAGNAIQLNGKSYSSVKEALKQAQKQAINSDMIFIGGSAFVVAEVI